MIILESNRDNKKVTPRNAMYLGRKATPCRCHVPKAITALKHLRKPSAAFQEANLHRKNFFFFFSDSLFWTLKTHDAKMKSSLN